MDREFQRGVYLLKERTGDADSPVVYFDGEQFWLPGWECSLTPTNYSGDTVIDVDDIGELLWADNRTSGGGVVS